MKTTIIVPTNQQQLDEWIDKLKEAGAQYELVSHQGKVALKLNEAAATQVLGMQSVEKKQGTPTWAFAIILLALFLIFLAIGAAVNKESKATASRHESDSTVEAIADIPKLTPEEIAAQKEALQHKIDSLQQKVDLLSKNFTFKQDEFRDIGFYRHKTWGDYWPTRKTLTAGVNSKGYVWLNSNYYSSDWIFHQMIHVKAGDTSLDSPFVPTYSSNNKSETGSGGNIYEVVTYDDDAGILKLIAENYTQQIKVRFEGKQYYDDITLSEKDKKAIKDCYELGRLIKERDGLDE